MKDNGIIPALTGVRAIAAYLVFLHHFITNPYFFNSIPNIVREGQVGVTVFFVLSGFLIAYRYKNSISIKFKDLFYYFRNRFARIYPMFFIVTVLAFLIPFLHSELPFEDFWAKNRNTFILNITFLKAFYNDIKFSGCAQSWSLTVEEVFYALCPIILIVCNTKIIRYVYAVIVLVCIGLLLVYFSSLFHLNTFFESTYFMFTYTFFGRSFEFMTGVVFAILFIKKKDFLPSINFSYTYIGLLGFTILLSVLYINSWAHDFNIFGTQNILGRIVNNVLLPFPIILFFYGLINETTFVQKVLSTKLFVLLGKSSYIFYLIHIGVIQKLFGNNVLIIFIGTNILSIIMYYCIEHPLNNIIRRIKI